ncbi:DinB family protein [Reichenbachiella ulvae]|uniref:DinB family protein n=1 Tax=Reichenbachiella ulvae TaxID=2980104 RepID=A0ABT3CV03_9BACT|nr:DinB family protein [Reichenbachiella ulvae]MCV9387531.1 DinB family protein [Reichenbachiella ulvae]
MKRSELIESLKKDTLEVLEEVKSLETLGEELLSRRPNPNKWSVIECIEHLNIADGHYLTLFEKKLPKAKASDKEEYDSSWMGNYFVKVMKPRPDGSIPSPMRTMSKFDPEVKVHADTLTKFKKDQLELIKYLDMAASLDLKAIKISSAIGRLVTFRLGDAFRFVIAHNQRHIIQAKNVLKALEEESVSV